MKMTVYHIRTKRLGDEPALLRHRPRSGLRMTRGDNYRDMWPGCSNRSGEGETVQGSRHLDVRKQQDDVWWCASISAYAASPRSASNTRNPTSSRICIAPSRMRKSSSTTRANGASSSGCVMANQDRCALPGQSAGRLNCLCQPYSVPLTRPVGGTMSFPANHDLQARFAAKPETSSGVSRHRHRSSIVPCPLHGASSTAPGTQGVTRRRSVTPHL